MRRKTMKNLTAVCFLAGTALLGRIAYVAATHHQGTRAPASYEEDASVDASNPRQVIANSKMRPQAQNRIAAPGKADLQRKIKTFFVKVHDELGNDETGNLAMVLFIRQLAPKTVAQDRRLKDLCTTQRTCPMNLGELYKTGLNRLDGDADASAKAIFQEQMVHSELKTDMKIAFLSQTMLTSKIQNLKSTSKMVDKSKVLFGTDAQYMLSTSRQLLELKTPTPQYLKTMIEALSRSHDGVAQQVVTKALLKAYPKYAKVIHEDAKKMKIQLAAN